MVLTMATHSACIQVMLYVYNPRWIEQVTDQTNTGLELFLYLFVCIVIDKICLMHGLVRRYLATRS